MKKSSDAEAEDKRCLQKKRVVISGIEWARYYTEWSFFGSQ